MFLFHSHTLSMYWEMVWPVRLFNHGDLHLNSDFFEKNILYSSQKSYCTSLTHLDWKEMRIKTLSQSQFSVSTVPLDSISCKRYFSKFTNIFSVSLPCAYFIDDYMLIMMYSMCAQCHRWLLFFVFQN